MFKTTHVSEWLMIHKISLLARMNRLEKIEIQSMRSIAKIVGTVLCVTGAIAMAFLKGPKLLNTELLPNKSVLGSAVDNYWLLGCLLLFGSSCCWSLWLILQVHNHPTAYLHYFHDLILKGYEKHYTNLVKYVWDRCQFQRVILIICLCQLGCVSWQHYNQQL